MIRIPHAVPNAESNHPASPLLINCRTCNQPIAVNLCESDFSDENGIRIASISKTLECPNCSTMNTRYFSWENEFGNDRLFAAVPTALVAIEGNNLDTHDDERWEVEVMQAETVFMDGVRQIGTDESWLELAWNLNHRLAFLTLYTAEGDTPIKCWQRRITIPEMRYEEDVDVIRHLTQLANLCYSLYAASPDAANITTELMDTLLDFRLFLEAL